MPTRIRWRDGREETVEDAQALSFEAQGKAEIIGGYVHEHRKTKSVDAPTTHRAVTSPAVKK